MRLIRYGEPGHEKPGGLAPDGTLRDLSSIVSDIDGPALPPTTLAALRDVLPTLPKVDGRPRLGACVATPTNFIAIGLNYKDHAQEIGMDFPKEPVIFQKASNSICGPHDALVMPRESEKLDWEVEIGAVIGTRASYVDESCALDHVAGLCLANDVSERAFQLERGGTWTKGKSAPTFGPLGPWLVTLDEFEDPQSLGLWLDVDGERMQSGTTADMIFPIATLVSYVSRFMTLEPGDVILTGTPAGVGQGRTPKRFLRAGETVTLGADRLGEQRHEVVTWTSAA